ncbi:hypothetical protein Clacol_006187 [Clathrus columnatus]|uniref:Senescence domain-containing protein n=1 Tax=Clathrus columnatus TaxID=1419009 RepID=A0AAV5AGZ7_9AGAM|nr:hypothetical protein Clacol_006187 [Clathrus columnatus]
MYSPNNVSGFLLLTLPNCTVDSPSSPPQTGLLSLQCVTLDLADVNDQAPSTSNGTTSSLANRRDVWLVLKLNSFEIIISPTQRINYSRSEFTYIFLPEEGSEFVRLVVPLDPNNPNSLQDLETMEVILSQYGVLHDIDAGLTNGNTPVEDIPPPYAPSSTPSASASNSMTTSHSVVSPQGVGDVSMSDFKGHLVLMDQDSGEVMGTLDEKVKLQEDEVLSAPKQGREKDPVVVELPSEEEEAQGKYTAYVHPADEHDRDMLIKTAGLISNGILVLSSALSTGITTLANFYISHSTPSETPIIFSPRTQSNVRRIHTISGAAVDVTSRTTNTIFNLLEGAVNRFTVTNSSRLQPQQVTSPKPGPPLPPRKDNLTFEKDRPSLPSPALPPRSQGSRDPSPRRVVGASQAGLSSSKPRLLNRILASTDIIITALERSATQLIESSTDAVSRGISHKYGASAGDMSRMTGNTIRNVSLVYVDVRGVGRRALLKRAGKAVVKAQFSGKDVVFMNGTNNAAAAQGNASGDSDLKGKGIQVKA